jgi:hypothetical protein
VKKWLLIVVLLFWHGLQVRASDDDSTFELNYTTELQTNFGQKFNWVNLLSLYGELPSERINKRWKNGRFGIEPMSIYKLHDGRVIDDIMDYSCIDEETVPFTLFLFGYWQQWTKTMLFVGLRNTDHDYFTTPYASLFTNSSAGIFRTLDDNFDIAHYPFSAFGVHLEHEIGKDWHFRSTLYNGVAHETRKKPFKSFTIDPKNDGLLSMSELTYSQSKFGNGIYSLGVLFHLFGQENQETKRTFAVAVEQSVFQNKQTEIGFLFHGGLAPPNSECRYYWAVGGYFAGLMSKDKRDKFGFYLGQGGYTNITETALELTWQYQLAKQIAIQPAFHVVRTGDQTRSVGLLRFVLTI